MKQIVFLFALLLLPLSASAYDAYINGIYYNIVKKANLAEVTYGDNAYSGDVVIPETVVYDGITYYVKNIGEEAFSLCYLNSLTIPASIDSIRSNPSGIENLYITDLASWCNIGFYHFYPDPRSMTEQRAYTTNPINVASNLYVSNKKVTSVDIPDGVTTIKAFAFEGASMVKSVTIPSSMKSIEKAVFSKCNIESVYITDLRAWCDISFAEASSTPFYSGDTAKHLYLNGSEVRDLVIPNGVTDLSYVFYRCSSIKTVSIPSSVMTISPNAFYGCTNMTSVTIPNSVTSIGSSAFEGCTSLTSVNIPSSVITIGGRAFEDCSSMKSVTIPNSVTSIEGLAFSNCTSLLSVNIPNSISIIGRMVFMGCSSLSNVIIPNSVKTIDSWAFAGCSSIPSIIIPNSVTNIESYAFQDCSSLKTVSLPNGITSVLQDCFERCTSLISITIPNSVDWIGDRAFSGCSSLTTIVLGTSMGDWTASNYNLGNDAFANCKELTDVYCLATAVPRHNGNSAFSGSMIEYATLHVRPDMVDNFRSSFLWKKFGTITALKTGDPGYDEQPKGDMNGDGAVNVGDIMAVINVMAGVGGEAEKAAADVNGDGAVNVGDIMAIINIMAGK